MHGWALDRAGIRRVEVRVDGTPYEARYGLPRPDVGKEKRGYPGGDNGGFEFRRDFAALAAIRHDVAVVAIANDGREAVLAHKSLVPPAAMHRASALLDARPSLAAKPFTFLMMTSGVVEQLGAAELDTHYRGYESRTTRVGMSVPILYLRTTNGAAGDYEFDPDFDLSHQCNDRPIAEDNLSGVIRYSVAHHLPVQFIMNGGIWADASCDIPAWDANDMLEQDPANCQWTAQNEVFPDDYLKKLPGSTNSPELARSLTYNVYASRVRAYKRRNLQAAARVIAAFAREHPDLFVGIALDADTYMNPFYMQSGLFKLFDYNPGMLKQFRHWLRGDGPYAGKPEPGAPNLIAYRRAEPLTLADVNRLARKQWRSWDLVEPPRTFPGARGDTPPAGEPVIWDDPWYQEWQVFRQHVVGLHYDELSQWAHEAGIPKDQIFSAQGFIKPDDGAKPIAIRIQSRGQNYDTSGVSIEGAIPRYGHLGAIIYGEWYNMRMEQPNSLFATFGRMDPGWAIVEFNPTDLKRPTVLPVYAHAYHAFRDMFNIDASEISAMAWNGSNGTLSANPDTCRTLRGATPPPKTRCAIFSSRTPTFLAARYCGRSARRSSRTATAGRRKPAKRFPATPTSRSSRAPAASNCARQPISSCGRERSISRSSTSARARSPRARRCSRASMVAINGAKSARAPTRRASRSAGPRNGRKATRSSSSSESSSRSRMAPPEPGSTA